MSRNALYAIIALLVIVLAVLGFMYYQEQNTASLDISVGENGVSVDAG